MFEKIPCRYVIAVMIFVSSSASFMVRTNLNVNLVAMVPVSISTYTGNRTTLYWNAYQRANVLASHMWGHILACIVGGPLAERWGARNVMFLGILFSAILTLVTPPAAKHSHISMLIVRFVLGVFSGFVYPACHVLISRWAVATDKGKFSGALMAGSLGIFFAWSICGQLIEPFGWEWGFYYFGIFCILILCLLWFLVYDSPDKHPYIKEKERKYLNDNITVQRKQQSIPYRQILTSIPFWSLVIINFGSGWGIFFVITAVPNYIANALGFNIAYTGVLSAITYLSQSTFAFMFGLFGDFLLQRKIVSVNVLRKTAIFLSHVMPGLGLLGMAYMGMPAAYYVTVLACVMAMNGSVTLTSVVNGHDLTRNFAGTVNSVAVAVMTMAGIITPYITAFFTKGDETSPALWQPVFYTGGTVFMATGLQFVFLGSTKTQYWNDITKEEDVTDGTEQNNELLAIK